MVLLQQVLILRNLLRDYQLLGDLFTKYSLETSVQNFFNSFRYSTNPIGIIGMEDYTLINNGAKELEGKWAIAPYLGTEQEDGSIDRTFVANGTGGAIFKTSNKKDESWEFLKMVDKQKSSDRIYLYTYVHLMVRHSSGYQLTRRHYRITQWMKLIRRLLLNSLTM